MIPKLKEIEKYKTVEGREPFSDWLKFLPNEVQARIFAYIRRLCFRGAQNHIKILRDAKGVRELKINFGPGYRVYFGEIKNRIILLLIGGVKRTQDNDIAKAEKYWRDYNEKA